MLAALFLAACASTPAPLPRSQGTVRVEGLVSLHARSFPGATVTFTRAEEFTGVESPAAAATSDAKGRFSALLEPGEYIVTARAPGYFALFGRNPVRAHADQRGLSLPLAPVRRVTSSPVATGLEGLSGTVAFDGAPTPDAVVQAYLDARKGFKGPPYAASAPSGGDGSFTLPLEPGTYFIVAKRRTLAKTVGPLEAGDLFGSLPEFPLRLAAGEAKALSLELVRLPGPEMMGRYQTSFAVLSGRIVDERGEPVAGFRPCLYANPRMVDEPVAVGDPTGPDGIFRIKTSRVGRFWLGARERLGGPPTPGERIGFPGPEGAAGFELTPGLTLDALHLTVRPAP